MRGLGRREMGLGIRVVVVVRAKGGDGNGGGGCGGSRLCDLFDFSRGTANN